MATKRELADAEESGWDSLVAIVESLSPAELEEPGYYPEGWSCKDLLAHLAGWQAEAAQFLVQIRCGTYRAEPIDVEAVNQRILDAHRDLPLAAVQARLWSARTRMLTEWNGLPEVTPAAEEWFRESGSGHYDEHLPRLRAWAAEVRAR